MTACSLLRFLWKQHFWLNEGFTVYLERRIIGVAPLKSYTLR